MSVVHAFQDWGDWAIWLDTEIGERDGLCIGLGKTLGIAVEDAMHELKNALRVLQNESVLAAIDKPSLIYEDKETAF